MPVDGLHPALLDQHLGRMRLHASTVSKAHPVQTADAMDTRPADPVSHADALDGVAMSALGRTFASNARGPARCSTSSATFTGSNRVKFVSGGIELKLDGFKADSGDLDGLSDEGIRSQQVAHPRALRGVPDPVAVDERLAIPPADDRTGTLERDRPLRREGAAVPRRMKAVRRCGRHDVPEGIACPPRNITKPPTQPRSENPLAMATSTA